MVAGPFHTINQNENAVRVGIVGEAFVGAGVVDGEGVLLAGIPTVRVEPRRGLCRQRRQPALHLQFQGERTGLAGVSIRALSRHIRMLGSSSPKAAPCSNPVAYRPDAVQKPENPQLISQPDDDCWR